MSRHQHHHHNPHHQQQPVRKSKAFHRDWRFITAVILMVIGIIVYVMTMDLGGTPAVAPDATVAPAAAP